MMLTITPIFLAIFIAMYIKLSFRVINNRRKQGVRLGDGGHETLQAAIRAQGNFSEYVPIFVLALLILELQKIHWLILLTLALTMLCGRGLHAYSVLKYEERHADAGMGRFKFRIRGMMCTFGALGTSAGMLLVSVVL